MFKRLRQLNHSQKVTSYVFLALQGITFMCLARAIWSGDQQNIGLCCLAIFSFCLPYIVEMIFHIKIPSGLLITIFVFIFASEVLGEINNFYRLIPIWDSLLHAVSGFLCCGVGFALVGALNKKLDLKNFSLAFLLLTSISFSMTVGVAWEFFEYSLDTIIKSDTQKDTQLSEIYTVTLEPNGENRAVAVREIDHTVLYDADHNELARLDGYLDIGLHDTIKDLAVNLGGAAVFGVCLALYVHDAKKYPFAGKFLLQEG